MDRDPLYEALGTGEKPAPQRVVTGARVVTVLTVVGVALIGATAFLHRGPAGQEVAVAPIAPAPVKPPEPPPSQVAAAAPPPPPQAGAPAVQSNGDTVEIQNGVKIIRMGPGRAALAGAMPFAPAPAAAPSVSLRAAPDPALIEPSGTGGLPRIGANGLRPADAYARPITRDPSVPPDAPRVAILLGGLGLNAAAMAETAQRLPGSVSFAFTPSGPDLAGQVGNSRDAGHEAFLEFSAQAQPGSAGASHGKSDPLEALHVAMGRFVGYVGSVVLAGSAYAADPASGQTMRRDMASRGLMLVEEKAAGGPSLVDVTTADSLESGRIDIAVDGTAGAGAVTEALQHVAGIARAKGHALGYVRVGPGTVDAIQSFAEGLARQGLELVPASAVVTKSKSVVGASP